jgi:hypothetical protein
MGSGWHWQQAQNFALGIAWVALKVVVPSSTTGGQARQPYVGS